MYNIEQQLQEFESIQSIYDIERLSFDTKVIQKLVMDQITSVSVIYLSVS